MVEECDLSANSTEYLHGGLSRGWFLVQLITDLYQMDLALQLPTLQKQLPHLGLILGFPTLLLSKYDLSRF